MLGTAVLTDERLCDRILSTIKRHGRLVNFRLFHMLEQCAWSKNNTQLTQDQKWKEWNNKHTYTLYLLTTLFFGVLLTLEKPGSLQVHSIDSGVLPYYVIDGPKILENAFGQKCQSIDHIRCPNEETVLLYCNPSQNYQKQGYVCLSLLVHPIPVRPILKAFSNLMLKMKKN